MRYGPLDSLGSTVNEYIIDISSKSVSLGFVWEGGGFGGGWVSG